MPGPFISKANLSFLTGGGDSDVFLLKLGRRRYALKIFRLFSLQDVQAEIKVMNILVKRSFPVPSPLILEGSKQYFLYEGSPAILYPYLPGKTAQQSNITAKIREEAGELLARIDITLRGVNINSVRRKRTVWDILQFEHLRPVVKLLPQKYKKFATVIGQTFSKYRTGKRKLRKLPRHLILNDGSEGNLLVKNGMVSGLVDFSDMVYAPHVCNLAILAAHLCFDDDNWARNIKAVVNSYQKFNSLPEDHLALFPLLIRVRVAALIVGNYHQQITRGNGRRYQKTIDRNIKRLKRLSVISDEEIIGLL